MPPEQAASTTPDNRHPPLTDPFSLMPGHLLRRCHQIALGIFHHQCRHFGITPLQYAVLSALEQRGTLDQVTLGGLVALDRTTTTHLVGKLLESGLVSRAINARDKRFKRVAITPAGRELLTRVAPHVQAVQDEIIRPLTPEEAEQLVSLLQKIALENNACSRAPQRGPE
ncbi:MAG TPA: MarR family winged helix-turn-helix transcriptional regulator [Thiolinea sp.]|nr:MarR family winged helix-turn-helix transcriptional regulator [Thiolinea sp.]